MAAELRLASALAIALLAGAVAAKPPPVLAPGDAGALVGAGSGLLLLAVESPLALKEVRLVRLEGEKEKGSFRLTVTATIKFNARLVVLPAGRYRLDRLELEGGGGWRSKQHARQLAFEVRAGVVNYPGDLALGHDDLGLRFESADRSGRARVWIEENHRGLLTRFPLRFAGDDDDGWTTTLVP